MNATQFLVEWTVRSSMLIAAGAFLLWVFRVTDPSIRLASWTAALLGSLAMPVLTSMLPPMPLPSLEIPISVFVIDHIEENPIEN